MEYPNDRDFHRALTMLSGRGEKSADEGIDDVVGEAVITREVFRAGRTATQKM